MALSKFGRKMFSYKGLTLMTAPLAVLVAAGAVMGASATLQAETSNDGNTWSTPNKLTLDVGNSAADAMFNVGNIAPGYTESHCITITNYSTVSAELRTYSADFDPSVLGNTMTVGIVAGSGGVDDDGNGAGDHCTGFTPAAVSPTVYNGTMSGFAANTDFATGLGSKTLASNESITYKITAGLPGATDPAAVEEMSTGLSFKWEIQK
jgi:hypothetical protein